MPRICTYLRSTRLGCRRYAHKCGTAVSCRVTIRGVRSGVEDDGGAVAGALPAGGHEPVAHVADRADLLLELGAELGAQPPDVDVDRAGAAVVVIAPDLLQQLGASEDPAGVLREVLQQLELLVGEVERASAHLGRVRGLVDDDVA